MLFLTQGDSIIISHGFLEGKKKKKSGRWSSRQVNSIMMRKMVLKRLGKEVARDPS